jgi:hypothetical protein
VGTFFAEIRGTFVPDHEGAHGPLPPILLAMTFLTGLVDAFSFLVLGHVFVANMTRSVHRMREPANQRDKPAGGPGDQPGGCEGLSIWSGSSNASSSTSHHNQSSPGS